MFVPIPVERSLLLLSLVVVGFRPSCHVTAHHLTAFRVCLLLGSDSGLLYVSLQSG